MTYMLCRNRVEDFERWKAVFSSHAKAHRTASLRLVQLWRDVRNPNNVFFLFEVGDMAKAHEFISTPAAVEAADESGVTEGEYHFVEDAGLY